MRVKEKSEKADLKLNIQKTNIMVFVPINLWQIDWETMETVTEFIFLDSKISINSECNGSYKIKKMLASRKKNCDKPTQHVKKQKQNKKTETLLCGQRSIIVKAMAFPVVMYGCESSTMK